MPQDYNTTLNLPQSEFPMRGNLPAREPGMLEEWDKANRYEKMIARNEGKPRYILHDGPPYANGDIHLGTALNKVLKDIIIKSKNMMGYQAPYVPGWDTHGLPTELKALKKDGVDPATIDSVSLRKLCKEFAMSYLEIQKKSFKRLGVLADYDHPYITLTPDFEAKEVELFGAMAQKGYVYKGLKPVYWCTECGTALAEAEIEYSDDKCYSIFVKFPVKEDRGFFESLGIPKSQVYFVIWTTTTWTLPGNVAICLGPDFEYTLVKNGEEYYVMAKELAASAMAAAKVDSFETIGSFKGNELENMTARHPFLDRDSLIIVGDHVTLESGTGCVHTAPGHGVDDFEVCRNYDLPIVVPVDNKGYLTKEAGQFEGLTTDEANKAIAKHLEEIGALLAIQKIVHSYPHCWRCHNPILFRATEQWFCSIEDFKDEAIATLPGIRWIPEWGEKRIESMIRDRSDWCISRQRKWGVPIPVVYCKDCGKPIITEDTIRAISDMFRKEGSDSWFIHDASEFIPKHVKCECGCHEFTKETDILDVWFDSGVSHAAVIDARENLSWPADLYLEGNDQYRGWFQSSLLTSVAWKGVAPYKAVCTHGMVLDGEGRAMHKSAGNAIDPVEITGQYGADILRLCIASSDYQSDIRMSKDLLKQISEAYRKIRNTAKYILGNLYDFNPDTDMVDYDRLTELDRLALYKLNGLVQKVNEAYRNFDFHIIYHAIHNFCVVDMSNFYLDIIKDRLYCEAPTGNLRRAAQTTIYRILDVLTRILAPIITFTADEIWAAMPHCSTDNLESVLFNDMIDAVESSVDEAFVERWNMIYAVRNDVQKALEEKRAANEIGKALEAKVVLHCADTQYELLNSVRNILPEVFICSQVDIVNTGSGEFCGEVEGLSITIQKAEGEKCERCWMYSTTVGQHGEHEKLCQRCAGVILE